MSSYHGSIKDKEQGLGGVFRKYALIAQIGHGSTSEILKAEDSLGKKVALKIFSPGLDIKEIDRKILEHEFLRIKNLQHPDVVEFLEYNEHNEFYFIDLLKPANSFLRKSPLINYWF